MQKRSPNIPLEGKEVSRGGGGGVVTNAPTADPLGENLDVSHEESVVLTRDVGEAAEQQKEELIAAAVENAPTEGSSDLGRV